MVLQSTVGHAAQEEELENGAWACEHGRGPGAQRTAMGGGAAHDFEPLGRLAKEKENVDYWDC